MADDDVTRLLALACHELRSPLAVLRLTLPRNGSPFDAAAQLERLTELVDRQTTRMQVVVDRYLDHGRLAYDSGDAALEAVSVATTVTAVVDRLGPLLASHDLRLELTPDTVAVGDAARLEAIVENLILNAVHFSPAGTEIHVSTMPTETLVRLEVVDEGIGIPPGEERRVLAAYVRGSNAHEVGGDGTGIGLAVVSMHVRAMGGRVVLGARRGAAGTIARVTLPRAAEGT